MATQISPISSSRIPPPKQSNSILVRVSQLKERPYTSGLTAAEQSGAFLLLMAATALTMGIIGAFEKHSDEIKCDINQSIKNCIEPLKFWKQKEEKQENKKSLSELTKETSYAQIPFQINRKQQREINNHNINQRLRNL